MSERKTLGLLLAALGLGCGPSSAPIGTVSLELGEVPERIKTIVAWAERLDREEIVDSATISASARTLELGVPVEVPVAFQVLARTDRPGPRSFRGTMPAYAARVVRTVPLGQGQLFLPITVRPAGVLTVLARLPDDRPRRLLIEDAEGEGASRILSFDPSEGVALRALALRSGRYKLSSMDEALSLIGGQGVFIAREQESIAQVELVQRAPVRDEPARIELMVEPVVRTSSSGAFMDLSLIAQDEAGQPLSVPEAQVELSLSASPLEVVSTSLLVASALPARWSALRLFGTGRVLIRAVVSLPSERRLSASAALNALGPGIEPGRARALSLSVVPLAELQQGAQLQVALLDSRGLFAAQTGELDLSMSDPFLYFFDGPTVALSAQDRGYLERRVALPAAPPGLPVVLRATLTSTIPGAGALTSSVTLPALGDLE